MKKIKILFLALFLLLASSMYAGKFVLTHLLGKALKTPAYFYVGSQPVWTLDFRNGDKLLYTIISFDNKDDLMCGINAKDNKGNYCTICIRKTDNTNKTAIDIMYSVGKLTYTGYYSE
jgi:hypothetical protein